MLLPQHLPIADELWDKDVEGGEHLFGVVALLEDGKVVGDELLLGDGVVVHLCLEDEVVFGGDGGVVVGEQLLVELLTGPEASDDDLASPVPVVFDELLGKVMDLYRTPHVEHHHLATRGHRRRLEDEAHRLGDGHEVADDLLVRHCDGNARLDLLHEEGKHASPAAEHVAEAHRDDLGLFARHRARQELDHPLGGSHHIGGIDRLVGGDDDHLLGVMLPRTPQQCIGAKDVVGDRLLRVELLQRHMLVGRCMEDQLRPVGLDDPVELCLVLHITDHRDDDLAPLLLPVVQCQREIVELRLIDVQENQLARSIGEQLAADLGSNGAACPGDEDALVLHHLFDRALVDFDQRSAEEVGVVEAPQIQLLGSLLDLKERGDDFHLGARLIGGIDGGDHPLLLDLGDGDDEDLRLLITQDLLKILDRAVDAGAQYVATLEVGIVIDEADDVVGKLTLLVLAYQRTAQLPRPVDDGSGKVGGVLATAIGEQDAPGEAAEHHQHEAEGVGDDEVGNPPGAKAQVGTEDEGGHEEDRHKAGQTSAEHIQ